MPGTHQILQKRVFPSPERQLRAVTTPDATRLKPLVNMSPLSVALKYL